MSKKVNNEKEIEKARAERKWGTVIEFAGALNLKSAGGNLNSGSDIKLASIFYLFSFILFNCLLIA